MKLNELLEAKSREQYYNFNDWKEAVEAAGGSVRTEDHMAYADGYDGEMGQFCKKSGDGWIAARFSK